MTDPIIETIGKRAKFYGIARLSRIVKVDSETIPSWLSGKWSPRFSSLHKVLDVLGLELVVQEKPGNEWLPEIVIWGQSNIAEFTEEVYTVCLERTFKDQPARTIILDSFPANQKFLAACAAWAIGQGLLEHVLTQYGTQETVSEFKLTAKGYRLITGKENRGGGSELG